MVTPLAAGLQTGYTEAMDHSPRFLKLCDEVRGHVPEVAAAEVAERLERGERFALVDVREESEVERGRIKGARAIGRGILERDIEKAIPDTAAEIILYCGGGFRSLLAAESLRRMGYTNVKSMAGGYREWKSMGLPTE